MSAHSTLITFTNELHWRHNNPACNSEKGPMCVNVLCKPFLANSVSLAHFYSARTGTTECVSFFLS